MKTVTAASPRTKANFYKLAGQSPHIQDAGLSGSDVKRLVDGGIIPSLGKTRSQRISASLRRCLKAWLSGARGVINCLRRALHHIADFARGVLKAAKDLVRKVEQALEEIFDYIESALWETAEAAGDVIDEILGGVDDAWTWAIG